MLVSFSLSKMDSNGLISAAPFWIFIFVFAFAFFPLLARAQNPNGTLRGEVQDASAARVAGARVVVQSTGSSITREANANERGEFRI